MAKIQVLDEQTINQIAAGEVIENPASVVKELVENSIDAGATKIYVEIQAGGHELILVQDNGMGMAEVDARLCIGRHATSKIRSHDDLLRLSSLGFRGEALSSIASISEFTMRTLPQENGPQVALGTHLFVQGGKIISCEQSNATMGTQVEVRSLFYNVPARKKFQKTQSKDTFEVTKLMMSLALAHPECEFEYVANFKKEFHVKATTNETLNQRISALLGQEFASSLKPVFLEMGREKIRLQGFVGTPQASRPTRAGQYLFINGRPITSLSFAYAIKEGYGAAIDPQRHPAFVVHLTIPSDSVDVNVHPQKKEVRFKKENEMKALAMDAVQRALFQTSPHAKIAPAKRDFSPNEFAPFVPEFNAPKPQTQLKGSFDLSSSVLKNEKQIQEEKLFVQPALPTSAPVIHVMGVFQEYVFLSIQWNERAKVPDFLKNSPGIIVADCKAALSRIAFEDLTEKKFQESASLSTQKLLVPIFLEFTLSDATHLTKVLPYLKNLGLEMREFGKSSFLIESTPAAMDAAELEDFIRDIIDDDNEFSLDPAKQLRRFAQIAMGFSARRKYPVTGELAKEIIKQLLLCNEPFICPLGSAIFALITKEEIQKKFI